MAGPIGRVAVIGAGTMGAAIAAHVASSGLPVDLLDIVPPEFTDEDRARGLTPDDPRFRNRFAERGLERARRARPAAFMHPSAARLVRTGNIEDHLDRVSEADWIVEVIVERLGPKRSLMERLEPLCRADALISTNTSGLPIDSIVEGRSADFRRRFFGTHFFNPPRYMKLLEIIAGSETDPAAIERFEAFAEERLGKGLVRAKDRPNFIANRILSVHSSFILEKGLEEGLNVTTIDALTGPLIGRPKTATLRLNDLVGIDVAAHVGRNLYELIPDDPYREVLRGPASTALIEGLVERGWLGDKSGQGFYKKARDEQGRGQILAVDPATMSYRREAPEPSAAVDELRRVRPLAKRLAAFFDPAWDGDRAARFVRSVINQFLAYAATVAPEVAFDLASVDAAVRWGFGHEMGPFELWDALGVEEQCRRIEEEGVTLPDWVRAMPSKGVASFYERREGRVTGVYDWVSGSYRPLPQDERTIRVDHLVQSGARLDSNQSAALLDMGEGVLLLEFHGKMNAIDEHVLAMMGKALELLALDRWKGLVIGNDGENFCVGANIMAVLMAAKQGRFDAIDELARGLQQALANLRACPKPVVAAVHGRALGGGAEVAIGVDRVVAAAESYIGLVEIGVGLVPAGGGVTELVRRVVSTAMKTPHADPLIYAQQVFETIGMAKVGTSAHESRDLGFLGPCDRIVMNRDHLLYEARREVLAMIASGYVPPQREPLYAGGANLYAALRLGGWSMAQGGYISDHDQTIAERLAWIIAGGDHTVPTWVAADHLLDLEREAFVSLVATDKTQARIQHMLERGKPLRN